MELPDGLPRPQLGPIATGLGEVFHYVVRSTDSNRTPTELRTLQDWVIKPELRKVPGVAEVNTWGGFEKQFHVVVETGRLIKYRLTFEELVEALQANNQNVGGGQIVRSGESLLVHGVGLTTNIAEIAGIVIKSQDGTPVRVGDVATVREDHEIRRGAVTADGRGDHQSNCQRDKKVARLRRVIAKKCFRKNGDEEYRADEAHKNDEVVRERAHERSDLEEF